jgi:hypothetical protein
MTVINLPILEVSNVLTCVSLLTLEVSNVLTCVSLLTLEVSSFMPEVRLLTMEVSIFTLEVQHCHLTMLLTSFCMSGQQALVLIRKRITSLCSNPRTPPSPSPQFALRVPPPSVSPAKRINEFPYS